MTFDDLNDDSKERSPFTKMLMESIQSNFDQNSEKYWEGLAEENAVKLTRTNEIYEFMGIAEELALADVFLLPFHGFNGNRRFTSAGISRQNSDYVMNIGWEVVYRSTKTGIAASYEADLLVTKRRIYEQGPELRSAVNLDFDDRFANLLEKHKNIQGFEKIFLSNFSSGAFITFEKQPKSGSRVTRYPSEETSVNRYNEVYTRFKQPYAEGKVRFLRSRLRDYWLDWWEIAHRAEFDFDYLETLEPLEMRFYELTQLLRFKNREKSVRELKKAPLKISYGEFCALMPLRQAKTSKGMWKQLRQLCTNQQSRGYLKDFSISRDDWKEEIPDLVLTFTF